MTVAEKCSCTKSTFKVEPCDVGPELKGRVKDDCKVLAGATASRAMPITAQGRWWEEQLEVHTGGQIRSLVLFNLSVRYPLGNKSELLGRQRIYGSMI